jgi:hypothetical protein
MKTVVRRGDRSPQRRRIADRCRADPAIKTIPQASEACPSSRMTFVDHDHAHVRYRKTTVGSRIFVERQSTESLRILKAFDQFRTGLISRVE